MKNKNLFLIAATVVLLIAGAQAIKRLAWYTADLRLAREQQVAPDSREVPATQITTSTPAPTPLIVNRQLAEVPPPAIPSPSTRRSARQNIAPNISTPRNQPALVDVSQAREALSTVGADPDAAVIWTMAINNPELPSDDRRNLIEDLNEDGFDDPRNLTPDDLPLIESRLALIEELAPDAIDDTNAAAFEEAYKDLVNMRARILGRRSTTTE